MTDTPKISIIVPIFNGGNYVDSCLDGIENQDFQDYEVCFVIDHKTADDSVKRVEKRMESNPRVRYAIQNDNGRLGFARNIGVDSTSGEYIWFLDVDDVPFPTYIKDMIGILDSTSSDIAITPCFLLLVRSLMISTNRAINDAKNSTASPAPE